ncbi:hypothetical protein MWU78_00015 [Arenibacter sp. F26102]|uniref:hypothetical protein n=1 Tax=Arenibacter sp. F26102 TaxID=2926416 RepID=UPI001FF523A1|nr:hypothetical protein [Arenibacter sp. F26102]MCK0144029.1 hypothetical protein [Arenibacter sp. F26102]
MQEETENYFIEAFEERLTEVKHTKYLIKNEINQIEVFTSDGRDFKPFDKDYNYDTSCFSDVVDFGNRVSFNNYFHQYLMHGECELGIMGVTEENELVPIDIDDDEPLIAVMKEAILFAQYYEWLINLQSAQTKKPAKEPLSQKEKLLALHYLKIDFGENQNNKNMAKVLSLILGLGEENIRKNLSYVSAGKNEVRTENNLKKVLQLFKNEGFNDLATTINQDIEKIKK